MKLGSGSSELFTVAMVVFEDNDEAQAADDRISLLRRELGQPHDFEFHFCKNSNRVREAFFNAVIPYEFFYYGFVINKECLYSPSFQCKNTFYKYVCSLVFENAKPILDDAIVKIDGSGDRGFRRSLATYLKRKINTPKSERTHIKKVSTPDSKNNNLVQLSDMICGAIARSYRTNRPDSDAFRKMVRHREISVRYWPQDT